MNTITLHHLIYIYGLKIFMKIIISKRHDRHLQKKTKQKNPNKNNVLIPKWFYFNKNLFTPLYAGDIHMYTEHTTHTSYQHRHSREFKLVKVNVLTVSSVGGAGCIVMSFSNSLKI